MRHCRRLLRNGSRSFYGASLLLPAYYRSAATALYAFCRIADDEIDQDVARERALQQLRERLLRIYAGQPANDPVDRALADVVDRFRIPQTLPLALLEGFEWDVVGRRYDTLSELYAYAARVAGTVGAMMAVLMGAREPTMLARACDLGVAMQLTNIARDVGEDARRGRLYLPVDWLRGADIDPDAWLAKPIFDARLAGVVLRLVASADVLYRRAGEGIAVLPFGCRPGIFAARSIYREIGMELQRRNGDSVSQRTVVGAGRKLRLLAAACAESLRSGAGEAAPPLDETRFLVEAVANP
jgi:phytoene synthase